MVSDTTERTLSALLADTEKRGGHQFVIALFRSLEGESLEDYSNRLFKHWKIGDAKKNDGVLLALYKGDRKWRVEVGYGLEGSLTDLEAAEMARQGVPHFKDGDFNRGVTVVAGLLAQRLTGETKRSIVSGAAVENFIILVVLLLGLYVILFVIFTASRANFRGNRYSRSSSGDNGWTGGGSGWSSGSSDSGGFSGGGGDSGGGGASGSW